jgi:hypothetical protein
MAAQQGRLRAALADVRRIALPRAQSGSTPQLFQILAIVYLHDERTPDNTRHWLAKTLAGETIEIR